MGYKVLVLSYKVLVRSKCVFCRNILDFCELLSSFSSQIVAEVCQGAELRGPLFKAALAVKLEFHLVKVHFQPRLSGFRLLISAGFS